MGSDSLATIELVSEVARAVADEIKAGFDAEPRSGKWTMVGGDTAPLPFVVFCPSLAGKTVRELEEASNGDVGCFRYYLGTAGAKYVNGDHRGATLHSIVVDQLEVADCVYTGNATIHARSFDYD